jgi:hypothetical protein
MRKFQVSIVALAAFALAGVASARDTDGYVMTRNALGAGGFNPSGDPGSIAQGEDHILNVTGIQTWDLVGDPSNTVLVLDAAAAIGLPSGTPIFFNGIGWNVNIETIGDSWLSENRVYFDDNIAPDLTGLFLRPGAGQNVPGDVDFSSGGVIKLQDAGIAPILLPNGMLRMEFHETFDDVADAADSTYGVLADGRDSSYTLQFTPEPTTLLSLGLVGLVALRRRR